MNEWSQAFTFFTIKGKFRKILIYYFLAVHQCAILQRTKIGWGKLSIQIQFLLNCLRIKHISLGGVYCHLLEHIWNVTAHARFGLSGKRTSPLKSAGESVQLTTGSRRVRISSSNGSNAGYTMFWGRVKDYWLHSPVSPSLPLPCITVCHQVSTELYNKCMSIHTELLNRNELCIYFGIAYIWFES